METELNASGKIAVTRLCFHKRNGTNSAIGISAKIDVE